LYRAAASIFRNTSATYPSFFPLLVGTQYTEQSGERTWSADAYFTGGNTYSVSSIDVINTVDDPIYLSERTGEFSYKIPVPVGTYEINIHLAEMYVLFVFLLFSRLTIAHRQQITKN
jgi:Malectin domain